MIDLHRDRSIHHCCASNIERSRVQGPETFVRNQMWEGGDVGNMQRQNCLQHKLLRQESQNNNIVLRIVVLFLGMVWPTIHSYCIFWALYSSETSNLS
eukprot:3452262-Amphidinium_carterae.1